MLQEKDGCWIRRLYIWGGRGWLLAAEVRLLKRIYPAVNSLIECCFVVIVQDFCPSSLDTSSFQVGRRFQLVANLVRIPGEGWQVDQEGRYLEGEHRLLEVDLYCTPHA